MQILVFHMYFSIYCIIFYLILLIRIDDPGISIIKYLIDNRIKCFNFILNILRPFILEADKIINKRNEKLKAFFLNKIIERRKAIRI